MLVSHLCVGFLFGFAVAISPAEADIPGQPEAADVKTIDQCLADATATKMDPDTCIGSVSRNCAEKAASIAAKEECSNRELLVWNAALTRDYAVLTDLLPSESGKSELRDVERDFLISKQRRCTFERVVHDNAPDALVQASQCNVRAIARQDLWLREQIGSFRHH